MNGRVRLTSITSITITSIVIGLVLTVPAWSHAATREWTGAGGNNRWSTAGNWSGNVDELQNETFGALLVSDQPIAVERAMYSDAGGQVWAAGTSATAVRLP